MLSLIYVVELVRLLENEVVRSQKVNKKSTRTMIVSKLR
jgi:hypothetical protein